MVFTTSPAIEGDTNGKKNWEPLDECLNFPPRWCLTPRVRGELPRPPLSVALGINTAHKPGAAHRAPPSLPSHQDLFRPGRPPGADPAFTHIRTLKSRPTWLTGKSKIHPEIRTWRPREHPFWTVVPGWFLPTDVGHLAYRTTSLSGRIPDLFLPTRSSP